MQKLYLYISFIFSIIYRTKFSLDLENKEISKIERKKDLIYHWEYA